MEFKTYTGNETLEKDGFQVFTHPVMNELIPYYKKDLEVVAKDVESRDVFRTKLGDIKQIQNLNFEGVNNILAGLIGAKKFKVLNNQYFCKPPNYKMTSAHQDNAYFESDRKVYTFWIPLQDVDILNSCMFYVPGSHKQGLVEHKVIGTNVRTRTGKTGFSLYSDYYKNKDFATVPMKTGEILVHDKDCMHFSSPNLSDDYRIAITSIIEILK
jgi:ectoine hydroxylase-related dioxygenase (phytanoyl-CoA dioxygenase family)